MWQVDRIGLLSSGSSLGSLGLENHLFGCLCSLRSPMPLRNIGPKCPNCPKRPN